MLATRRGMTSSATTSQCHGLLWFIIYPSLIYITKEMTFKNIEKWINEVKEHAEPDIVLMLVGNKLDIVIRDPSQRAVSTGRAEEFARKHNILFIETSAFTDTNVRDSFETLV